MNPVRARIVETAYAAEYRWSSLRRFHLRTRPAWLEPATVLREAGGLPDTAHGWKKYAAYLEFLATDDIERKRFVASRMSRGWCMGGEAFVESMRAQARGGGL